MNVKVIDTNWLLFFSSFKNIVRRVKYQTLFGLCSGYTVPRNLVWILREWLTTWSGCSDPTGHRDRGKWCRVLRYDVLVGWKRKGIEIEKKKWKKVLLFLKDCKAGKNQTPFWPWQWSIQLLSIIIGDLWNAELDTLWLATGNSKIIYSNMAKGSSPESWITEHQHKVYLRLIDLIPFFWRLL